jgi:plasmid stabilization system protein ParE
MVPEYDADSLRELLESPYRIIYEALAEQINIIAVIHSARKMPPSPP